MDQPTGSQGRQFYRQLKEGMQVYHPSVKLGILASAITAGALVALGKAMRLRRIKAPWYTRFLQRTFR